MLLPFQFKKAVVYNDHKENKVQIKKQRRGGWTRMDEAQKHKMTGSTQQIEG